jgi:hypothetical protein
MSILLKIPSERFIFCFRNNLGKIFEGKVLEKSSTLKYIKISYDLFPYGNWIYLDDVIIIEDLE